jgi:hypothetical protein
MGKLFTLEVRQIQHVKLQTLTFTSMRVRPSSLIVGNTRNGRLTPSVIRYLW